MENLPQAENIEKNRRKDRDPDISDIPDIRREYAAGRKNRIRQRPVPAPSQTSRTSDACGRACSGIVIKGEFTENSALRYPVRIAKARPLLYNHVL